MQKIIYLYENNSHLYQVKYLFKQIFWPLVINDTSKPCSNGFNRGQINDLTINLISEIASSKIKPQTLVKNMQRKCTSVQTVKKGHTSI